MSEPRHNVIECLLGYHLGICEEHDRATAETVLKESPTARVQVEALERTLRPLDCYRVEHPTGLVNTVLDRVQRGKTIPFRRGGAGHRTLEATDSVAGSRPLMSMKELLSLAAAIALFAGVFLPSYQRARMTAAQNLCLDHMRQLGSAMGSYVAASDGMLPYSPATMSMWSPTSGTLPQAGKNLQQLQQANILTNKRLLTCPGGDECAGFRPEYNFQLYLMPLRIDSLPARMPIASDSNPLIEGGRYLPVDALRNSDAHGPNAGQNVLYLDGAALWQNRPTVGIKNDDIFKSNDPSSYGKRQSAKAIGDDVFLIP